MLIACLFVFRFGEILLYGASPKCEDVDQQALTYSEIKALRKLPIDPERKLPVFKITIGDVECTDRKEAARALEDAVLAIKYADTPVKVGSFQGFDLSVTEQSVFIFSSRTGWMSVVMRTNNQQGELFRQLALAMPSGERKCHSQPSEPAERKT